MHTLTVYYHNGPEEELRKRVCGAVTRFTLPFIVIRGRIVPDHSPTLPALACDDKLLVEGCIPDTDEIVTIIREALPLDERNAPQADPHPVLKCEPTAPSRDMPDNRVLEPDPQHPGAYKVTSVNAYRSPKVNAATILGRIIIALAIISTILFIIGLYYAFTVTPDVPASAQPKTSDIVPSE